MRTLIVAMFLSVLAACAANTQAVNHSACPVAAGGVDCESYAVTR